MGLSLGVNRMWTKKNDHVPKNECVDCLNICPKWTICKKKIKFDHSFVSLLFTSLVLLFSLVFTLNSSKHGCNGGKEEENYFSFRIMHVLYMLVKHVVRIQAWILQGQWKKLAILRLVYDNMGHRHMNS